MGEGVRPALGRDDAVGEVPDGQAVRRLVAPPASPYPQQDPAPFDWPEPLTRPGQYDPAPKREVVRGGVAWSLVCLFSAVTLLPLVSVIVGWATWEEVEPALVLSYSTVAGLLGTALAFYYTSGNRR